MARLRMLTAGESHGDSLLGILEGLPAGVPLDRARINAALARRQRGPGRSERQRIERDEIEVLAGLRFGETTGAPLAIRIRNRVAAEWAQALSPWGPPPATAAERRAITVPRPGHADLAAFVRYGRTDLRDAADRASGRNTAMTVALGAIAAELLGAFGVRVHGWVRAIGVEALAAGEPPCPEVLARTRESVCACPDAEAERRFGAVIASAIERGVSLGGVVEVTATGVPPGLGSYAEGDRRLDGRLAGALMAIASVKGVEVGDGFALARAPGDEAHDPILLDDERRLTRPSNRAGGIEGGVTNGEALRLRLAVKPVPTQRVELPSVDLVTGTPAPAHRERADACHVPAVSVVAEAVTALTLADAFLERFGGDTLAAVRVLFDATAFPEPPWRRPPPRNLYLIGFSGGGKSTLGARLAAECSLPFRDTDEMVERRAGRNPARIIAEDGEAAFRALEREAVARVAGERGVIVALGGGAIVDPAVRALLRMSGRRVHLRVDVGTALARLANGTARPLLEGEGDAERRALAEALLAKRTAFYAEAEAQVDAARPAEEVLAALRAEVERLRGEVVEGRKSGTGR